MGVDLTEPQMASTSKVKRKINVRKRREERVSSNQTDGGENF